MPEACTRVPEVEVSRSRSERTTRETERRCSARSRLIVVFFMSAGFGPAFIVSIRGRTRPADLSLVVLNIASDGRLNLVLKVMVNKV